MLLLYCILPSDRFVTLTIQIPSVVFSILKVVLSTSSATSPFVTVISAAPDMLEST